MGRKNDGNDGVGEQEWELLQFIAGCDGDGITVGEAADAFGKARDLSRSTVVTMMERLRAKNFLTRAKGDGAGVFRYFAARQTGDVQRGLIARFVEKTLAGSLTPLAAYFANAHKLTPSEMAELRRLLAKLDSGTPEEITTEKDAHHAK